jgi:transcriptional regulator with XRE-family HTH domain
MQVTPSIGERVRKARLDAGLTQIALSELVEIEQSHLSKIERDAAEPRATVLGKIAIACRVTSDWLLFGNRKRRGLAA